MQHVMFVGFHAAEAPLLDTVGGQVTAVLSRASAQRLPEDVAARFAWIVGADVPDVDDLDAYDDAFDQLRAAADTVVERCGAPTAVVGLYEHTALPAARLREALGLPGTSVRSARLCRDKVAMKTAVAAAGLPTPRFLDPEKVRERADVAGFVAGEEGRFVVKPRGQSASAGVHVLDSAQQLLEFVDAGGLGRKDQIEEFVDGGILHLDGVVRGGVVRWFCPSKYVNTCLDFTLGASPVASVTIDSAEFTARALHFTRRVLAALDLTDTVFHLEVFHTPDDRLVFLEIAARPGGAGVPTLARVAHGVDLFREAVRACTGEPSELGDQVAADASSPAGAAGFLIIPMPSGPDRYVRRVDGLDRLPRSVVRADVPEVGAELTGDGIWASSGFFLLRGDSTRTLEADMDQITRNYDVVTAGSAP